MPEFRTFNCLFFIGLLVSLHLTIRGQDYPEVFEEAHHLPVYENEDFRVLHVFAKPGDTTAFHRHCNPILYLTIKGSAVALNEPDGEWNAVDLPSGWTGHDLYSDDSCYVHRFSVIGESSLEIVAIEFKRNTGKNISERFPDYDNDGIYLYRLNGKEDDLLDRYPKRSCLAVSQDGETTSIEVLSSKSINSLRGNFDLYYIAYVGFSQTRVGK